ncbi:MAG: hypothetical protein PHH49_04625 [Candidatus Omnitrophica bacterium]|nr:hypothetical protein [Candidatus Omnitrophota bacterium]MDD5488232.1 hypothetical protein [Candidatus Omnitrophota bacterium]
MMPTTSIGMSRGLKVPYFQKGICYVTWEKDKFASKYSDQSIEMLKNLGVEYLQINVTWYQQSYNSTRIAETELTPSDKSVRHAIQKAHKCGLKVMLKPHIDIINSGDGYWRADIGFYKEEDWDKWFKEYDNFISHYANMAQKENVEIFCVGTELSFAAQKEERWRTLIGHIRAIYPGKLIYAANWDNYKNIRFWDALDYAGIDAYFPLSYKKNPDLEDLKKGWEKWIYEISVWHAEVNKPVIFTEIGYSSSSIAPSEPWKNGVGEADVALQARCYEAFFESVWRCDWLEGVYWWRWAPTVKGGGMYNRRYTPLNKPAAEILAKRYKEVSSPATGYTTAERISREADRAQEGSVMKNAPIDEKFAASAVFKAQRQVTPETNIQAMAGTATLMPELKTKYKKEFRNEWEMKRTEFMATE